MTTSLLHEGSSPWSRILADTAEKLDRVVGLPLSDTVAREIVPGIRAFELWAMLGWEDIRQRYRRSALGPIWITLSMAIFILLLSLIYSRILGMEVVHYMPFFSLGFIIWGFISQTLSESCRAFQDSEGIIKQIKLPFMIYVLRVVWRNFIVFLHTIVIFIPVAIICGVYPSWMTLAVIPGLALVLVNSLWITLVLAILSARYRDFMQIVNTTVHIMMFATPILWPVHSLGGSTLIADINPLYHMIELVRAPMLGTEPDPLSWLVATGIGVVGSMFAITLLARTSRRIVFWL